MAGGAEVIPRPAGPEGPTANNAGAVLMSNTQQYRHSSSETLV